MFSRNNIILYQLLVSTAVSFLFLIATAGSFSHNTTRIIFWVIIFFLVNFFTFLYVSVVIIYRFLKRGTLTGNSARQEIYLRLYKGFLAAMMANAIHLAISDNSPAAKVLYCNIGLLINLEVMYFISLGYSPPTYNERTKTTRIMTGVMSAIFIFVSAWYKNCSNRMIVISSLWCGGASFFIYRITQQDKYAEILTIYDSMVLVLSASVALSFEWDRCTTNVNKIFVLAAVIAEAVMILYRLLFRPYPPRELLSPAALGAHGSIPSSIPEQPPGLGA